MSAVLVTRMHACYSTQPKPTHTKPKPTPKHQKRTGTLGIAHGGSMRYDLGHHLGLQTRCSTRALDDRRYALLPPCHAAGRQGEAPRPLSSLMILCQRISYSRHTCAIPNIIPTIRPSTCPNSPTLTVCSRWGSSGFTTTSSAQCSVAAHATHCLTHASFR